MSFEIEGNQNLITNSWPTHPSQSQARRAWS